MDPIASPIFSYHGQRNAREDGNKGKNEKEMENLIQKKISMKLPPLIAHFPFIKARETQGASSAIIVVVCLSKTCRKARVVVFVIAEREEK